MSSGIGEALGSGEGLGRGEALGSGALADAWSARGAGGESTRLLGRRTAFLSLVIGTVTGVALLLVEMMRTNGLSLLEGALLPLSIVLLLPLAISFWMALLGFAVELRGGDPFAIDADDRRAPTRRARRRATLAPDFRTAIVVPVYNEDPERVLAGLRATYASLLRTGSARHFDFVLLSDSSDPQRWLEEELAMERFTASLGGPEHVHYRHRPLNLEHKAGNIAEFCTRWGERYRYMIVFDADSVMSGETLVRLVELMERHPHAGIIQVPPVPVNRRTLFGRLQQFAAGLYGPTWTAGLAWLQGGDGNYYGHNAIVRIEPFAANCRLPKLKGRAPLGGSILSHDFVEAALMRRAGYHVHLAVHLGGSYEESPPTLIDYAARDRRWCQGNLQHARLLGMPGLHPVSRAHLFLGVMSYASAPLWILLLLLSSIEALRNELAPHEYFAAGGSLFPVWEISIEAKALLLLGIVVLLLFLPRALAVCARLREPTTRRRFGGSARLVLSGLAECVFSTLLAPVLALMQTRFVLGTLLGRSTGWGAQPRGDRSTSWREALRRHAGASLLGFAWGGLLWSVAPELFWWMSPVLFGLALAVPLSVLSSRASAGEWARRRGLFTTPEELEPPRVLRALHAEQMRGAARAGAHDERSALERLLADPLARAVHLAYAEASALPRDELHEHQLQGLVLKCRLRGPASLNAAEQRELLLAPDALRALVLADARSA